MTTNQIRANEVREAARANRAREAETSRSNKAQEAETKRSNLRNEDLRNRERISKTGTGIAKNIADLLNPASWIGKIFSNHPEWYNLDSQLVRDVGSISYHAPLGSPVDFGQYMSTDESIMEPGPQYVPGIMGLRYIPTVGVADGAPSNALNIAAKNIYAYVRHANSGHTNYESTDLMLYLLAMDSIYSLLAYAKRMYNLTLMYDNHNRYVGEGLLRACGLGTDDIQDIRTNLANYRTQLNILIAKASALNVPNVFSYYHRHIWMNSVVFKDADLDRSQLYIFAPYGVWQFDSQASVVDNQTYGGLKEVKEVWNFSRTLGSLTNAINALISDEDSGIISGDILKAYGNENLFKLSSVTEYEPVPIVYEPSVLTQIAGATLCGEVPVNNTWGIRQTSDGMLYQGQASSTPGVYFLVGSNTTNKNAGVMNLDKIIVNQIKNDISPDDNMVATRLAATRKYRKSGDNDYFVVDSCGSEIICFACIVTTGQLPRIVYDGAPVTFAAGSRVAALEVYKTTFELSKFDWTPRIRLTSRTTMAGVQNYYPVIEIYDLFNYAVIDKQILDNMHNVALQSELAVPMFGNRVRKL